MFQIFLRFHQLFLLSIYFSRSPHRVAHKSAELQIWKLRDERTSQWHQVQLKKIQDNEIKVRVCVYVFMLNVHDVQMHMLIVDR
jgi:hypothetical protein